MAFAPFIDDLGFVVALILAGAAVLTYASIRAFWHILRNDPVRVRATFKASAVPAGIIGIVTLALGLWTEFTWPYLLSDGLGSYNIFFGDIISLFGMVMIVYAIVGGIPVINHEATITVIPQGSTSHVTWDVDVDDNMTDMMCQVYRQSLQALKDHLSG